MITLLARGHADCEADGTNCGAEALIAEKLGAFGPGRNQRGPGAPPTARPSVPLNGTVEIVPNPHGGGARVPISSWVNATVCGDCLLAEDPISPISGSYSTCEAQEWYGQDTYPSDYKCPSAQCQCKASEGDRLLTYATGNERQMGIDIVEDPFFPCDLWDYTFGMSAQDVKKKLVPADHQLVNCDSLDENSSGVYWVSGNDCTLRGQIGTAETPVFLISAAATTKVTATVEFFGLLFVTDKENPNAQFSGTGTATIYGAAIMDADMKHFQGTFQIVYLENVIGLALDTGLFGAVAGGWADFHTTWQ